MKGAAGDRHGLQDHYAEKVNSYVVVCVCGWKEKALSREEAFGRHMTHQRMPHRK